MMRRKFSGNWKGSDSTTSLNSNAKSWNCLGSSSRNSANPMPPNLAKSVVMTRSSSTVSADGRSTPTSCIALTMPLPSRDAAAITSPRRVPRRLAGTSPIMPKSTKVSVHGWPSCPGAAGVTNRFPGCGSAWKKPCRNNWSNITSAKADATSEGSMPAERSAAVSVILIAVTSSSVSTRRVVRSQATVGTRTLSFLAKFSANRSEFAPSCR